MSRAGVLEVKRFAVKYDPPTLVVEYLNTGNGKTYVKKIRLIGVIGDDATRLTEKIINENHDVLGPNNASRDQILSLMQLIVDKSKNPKVANKLNAKEYGDLNKASDVIIEKAKSEMNVGFEANRITPDDKNFLWDKKVDFEPPSGISDWDEEDD